MDAEAWVRSVLAVDFPHEARVTDDGGEQVLDSATLRRLHDDGELVPLLIESRQVWLALAGFSVTLEVHDHR
ncbi:MAG: hypothetical protein OXH75_07710 [Acidobacteria bacterium]|nr:hypothetical protein [Acidobacteriota bacterium]